MFSGMGGMKAMKFHSESFDSGHFFVSDSCVTFVYLLLVGRGCDPCSCCRLKKMEHDQQDKGFDLVRRRGLYKRCLVNFGKCVCLAACT